MAEKEAEAAAGSAATGVAVRAGSGSRTVNSAPPSSASARSSVPEARETAWPTSARPRPRPGPRVVQPRPRTTSRSAGRTPGPLSPTRSSSSPSPVRAATVTVTRACGVPLTASTALSTRLPRIVTRSRDGRVAGTSPSSIRLSSVRTSSTPRSLAWAALPRSSAASTGSPTASTTRSVRAWASSSSAVANSTASVTRPSSMSETTVCSRLAASCACERSASVNPRSESNSPESAWSSVRSRRVATVPRRSPPTTGRVLTTRTRSAVRCVSSTRGPEDSRAPVSVAGRPSSAAGLPTTPSSRPSSSRAPSLMRAIRRRPSSITSPSRTACSAASW